MRARVACLDVPALPLQLLSRQRPEWADAPLAVVEADHPQAKILWVDRRAARKRVRVGMRYASALQLSRELRAAPVPEAALRAARAEILEALQARTPRVEPDPARAGVYWLDPSGMGNLFGPLERWSANVHDALTVLGFDGAVVVGFGRLPSWAIARVRRGPFVIESPAEEARLAGRVPLTRLEVPPELRDALLALGITDLGGFLSLPRGDVGTRFGAEARALHARFADALRDPMQPAPFVEPIVMDAELEPPDDDQHRLLFCIKGALHALLHELARRSLALGALTITFELERAEPQVVRIEPARATRDGLSVLELVRLRLASLRLASPAERLVLTAEPASLDGTQLALFGGRRKDPEASARGIARLRAMFGDAAVTRARLKDGWLPENGWAWEPVASIDEPRPRAAPERGRLVRRVLPRPEPLPTGPDRRPLTRPALGALTGPYRLQGGWWVREAARDYYFGEREDGALLWLYFDRRRERWFLHGQVD